MNRLTHTGFLIILLSLWCSASYSQKLRYDIFLLGNKIGETTIERKDSAGLKLYSLRSKSDAKVLFIEKKSCMSTEVLFDKNGNLFSSLFENIRNEEKFLTKVFWDNKKLIVNRDGEKTVLPMAVNFSSLVLYFTEPPNMQKVFSERLGQFFEMVKQSDGTYLTSLDGHTAVYTYKAGKLIALEMKGSLGSILMKIAP
jgi:hypothetical protein